MPEMILSSTGVLASPADCVVSLDDSVFEIFLALARDFPNGINLGDLPNVVGFIIAAGMEKATREGVEFDLPGFIEGGT